MGRVQILDEAVMFTFCIYALGKYMIRLQSSTYMLKITVEFTWSRLLRKTNYSELKNHGEGNGEVVPYNSQEGMEIDRK